MIITGLRYFFGQRKQVVIQIKYKNAQGNIFCQRLMILTDFLPDIVTRVDLTVELNYAIKRGLVQSYDPFLIKC